VLASIADRATSRSFPRGFQKFESLIVPSSQQHLPDIPEYVRRAIESIDWNDTVLHDVLEQDIQYNRSDIIS
jgi:hypothetical protein